MTYSDEGPWHNPKPQTLSATVGSAWPEETGDFTLTIQLTRELPADCGVTSKWGDPQKLLESGKLDGASPVLPAFAMAEAPARGRMVRITDGASAALGVAVLAAGVVAAAVAGVQAARNRRRAASVEPLL